MHENVPPEIATRERNEFAVTVYEFLRREQARLGGASHATAAFLVLLHTESGRELLPCKSLMGQLFKVALLDSDRHNILLTVVARPPPVLRLLHEHPFPDRWGYRTCKMVFVRFDEYDVAREISFVYWADFVYTFLDADAMLNQKFVVATKDAVPDKAAVQTEGQSYEELVLAVHESVNVWLLRNWCYDDFEHTLREHFRRIGCEQAVEMREHISGGNIIWGLVKSLWETNELVIRGVDNGWRATAGGSRLEVQSRSIRLIELLCDLGMLGPLMKSFEDKDMEKYYASTWRDWDRSIADDMGFPEVRDAIKKMLGSDK